MRWLLPVIAISMCLASTASSQTPLFSVVGELKDVQDGNILIRKSEKEDYYFTSAELQTIDINSREVTSRITADDVLQAFAEVNPSNKAWELSYFYTRFGSSAQLLSEGFVLGIPGFQPTCDCPAGVEAPITPGYVVRVSGEPLQPVTLGKANASHAENAGFFTSGNSISYGQSIVASGEWYFDAQQRYDAETLVGVGSLEMVPRNDDLPNNDFTGTLATDGELVLRQRLINRQTGSGDVGLFDFESGEYLGQIAPESQRTNDRFGEAMDTDDAVAVIGAPGWSHWRTTENGSAYVYDLTSRELVTELVKPPLPLGSAVDRGDSFGRSVALEGNLALVGAPMESAWGTYAGAAFLYDATTGELLHMFKPPPETSNFGVQVAFADGHALIGNGAEVFVYAIPEASSCFMLAASLLSFLLVWRRAGY